MVWIVRKTLASNSLSAGPLFQFDDLRIQAVQILRALEEKFSQYVLFRHKELIGTYCVRLHVEVE